MDKLTPQQQTSIIEEYTRVQSVCMMALSKLLENEECRSVMSEKDIQDVKTNFELFLYDLKSIDNLMSDNMELLWELKDKLK